MKHLLLIALLLNCSSAFSQNNNYGNHWITGTVTIHTTNFHQGLTINSILGNISFSFLGGHSCISDSAGKFILMSDGFSILDTNGTVIDNGYKIVNGLWDQACQIGAGWLQASLFLPAGNGLYHFINVMPSDSMESLSLGAPMFDNMFYSLVDMKANNGQGKVVKRMIPLIEHGRMSITQMTACKHGDGKSWWILKQAHDTNMIYSFLLTKDSIFGPFIQGFPEPHFGVWHKVGQSVFTNDGNKYATAITQKQVVFVADFDRCSGQLSNPKSIDIPLTTIWTFDSVAYGFDATLAGVAFSPSGRFLYIARFTSILQLDLWDSNMNTAWDTIAGMDNIPTASFKGYYSLNLAPDNKIYVGNWNGGGNRMSVINEPDKKGDSCSFCKKCMVFPIMPNHAVNILTPPNMVNYALGAANPICWPAGVEEVPPQEEITVYPNPFEATLIIQCSHVQNKTFYLYDSFGKLILTKTIEANKEQINTANLAAGLYFYSIINKNGERVKAGKVVKE